MREGEKVVGRGSNLGRWGVRWGVQEIMGGWGVHIAEAATVKRNRCNTDIQLLHVLHITELASRPYIHMQPHTHPYILATMPTDHQHQVPFTIFVSSYFEMRSRANS